MSLYGPRLNLPKVNFPNPSNPSWNMDKEKKLIIGIGIALLILLILVIIGPIILKSLSEITLPSFNPAVQVDWENNPLYRTQGMTSAQLTLIITNNTKELIKELLFNVKTDSGEIEINCPNSLYDVNKSNYVLYNLSPNDVRKIPCIVRRLYDPTNELVYSGTYTIKINTTLGNTTTNFEIITK